ncbi:MAG: PatB family C-S lyase, partial [Dehalococcoidia bacterium]
SGDRLLSGLVTGYEVALRFGYCWHDDHDRYQACGSWGTVACAAAAAHLMKLPENRIRHALGIADYHAPNLPMMRDSYGWEIEPGWIIWLPGLVTGLNVSCRAVGNPGDGAMTTVPIYPPFLTAPKHSDRKLQKTSMLEANGKWVCDFDRFERALTDSTRLFILCNPQNPTGRVFTREELARFADICLRHDIIICSDEIHCQLILDEDRQHIPTATLSPEIADRTITLMAPSKTYNLPGLGCSFAIIPNRQLRKRFKTTMAGIVPFVNALGYTAALAAYRDGADWLKALLDYLRENRQVVEQAVAQMPELSMNHVEATYLAWIDTRQTGLANPVEYFEEAGVGLSDGIHFDGPGFVRLNFGCPRPRLEEALRRMREAASVL